MLWQNSNTIVVGRHQNTFEEVNHKVVREQNIDVVRRQSGGGAVYHDTGNLNYTFITKRNSVSSFEMFVSPIIDALRELGVIAEFSGRNDITINGYKISGNSQYTNGDTILHHGCIMLDSNLNVVSAALKVNNAKYESKGTKSIRSRVTTINNNSQHIIEMDELINEIKKQVFKDSTVIEYELTEKDEEEISALQQSKYETWEWNYGKFKKYSMRREQKFISGVVTIEMDVSHGIIEDIRITGDYFGSRDTANLADMMVGLALDDNLEKRLQCMNIQEFINGVTASDIAAMLK